MRTIKQLLLAFIATAFAHALSIKDTGFEQVYKTEDFIGVKFDPNFLKALFLYKKGTQHEMALIQLGVVQPPTYHVMRIPSNVLFAGLMNSGNIMIATQTDVSIVNKKDGYTQTHLKQPSEFMKTVTGSQMSMFNDFNQTVLFMFNQNRVGEIDARQLQLSRVNEIPTNSLKPGFILLDLVYIESGKKIALLVNESDYESVMIFDQKSRQFLTRVAGEVDNSKKMIYNLEMNIITFIKTSTKQLLLFDSATMTLLGSINYSLTGLIFEDLVETYSPLGTSILIVNTKTEAYFFCLRGKSFIGKVSFNNNAKHVYWAEGTNFFMTEQIVANETKFRVFTLESSDSRLCHKSCGSNCKEVFKACDFVGSIWLSMFLGFVLLAFIAWSLYAFSKWLVVKSGDTEITDEEGNLYELTETGNVKPKRNTISLAPDQDLNL